uniref:Uncharacterized protein n=1 Tax=Anguilla anguilla TaxID=7936 RepID=A0A0E9SCX5_ANGAN
MWQFLSVLNNVCQLLSFHLVISDHKIVHNGMAYSAKVKASTFE